ncbi:hypothetical protein Tco_0927492, partial [Tanacetum coccineum]
MRTIPPSTTEGVGARGQAHGLAHEAPSVETATTTEVVQEPVLEKEVAAMGPPVNKRCRQSGTDKAEENAPPKVLRKDHATPHPAQNLPRERLPRSSPNMFLPRRLKSNFPWLLKEARAKIARRDQRIRVRDEEIKKLDEEIKSLRTI